MEKEKKRQRTRKRFVLNRQVLFGILLTGVVLIVMCVVGYALSLGSGIPDARDGQQGEQLFATAMTTEPPTTEPPTTEPPTTEPPETSTAPKSELPTEPSEPEYVLQAQELLETMTLEEKIWQMIFLTQEELTDTMGTQYAGEGTREALRQYPIGGVIYFSGNISSEGQLRDLISNTQSFSKIPLMIGVDEEGGRVSRLSGIGVTDYVAPMASYGSARDEKAVYDLGQHFAESLIDMGFNVNYAPVADIVTNPDNTEIGDRSFSEDPTVAAAMVVQMVKGMQDGGLVSCLKHFPGHGSTSADSHYGMSVSERSLEELRGAEFIPFAAGIEAGAELVMMSHMSLPKVTGSDGPCDLSYEVVTGLLRRELGFEGVIISDSHEMAAITAYYSCGEAAVLAVKAGCDVVLMPESKQAAANALLEAVADGTLSEARINESVLRILSLKYEYGIIE